MTPDELKYLLKYLRTYYDYWYVFDEIDINDDWKITVDEFKKAKYALDDWGIKGDAAVLYKEIDQYNAGFILFD